MTDGAGLATCELTPRASGTAILSARFAGSSALPGATAAVELTVTGGSRPGDCNGDGHVTVDELVLAVNIALEIRPPENYRPTDGNADGRVAVDELVRAVNAALFGCP